MIPVLLSILSAKETTHLREAIDETLDFLNGGGRRDRGTRGRSHLEECMERDRAVVPDAHGHVHGVHELADVVRMHTVDGECNDADTINVRVRAEDLNAVDRRDSIEHHGRERVLVGFHAVHAECRQVAQGLGPCGDLCDGLRSRFEAP